MIVPKVWVVILVVGVLFAVVFGMFGCTRIGPGHVGIEVNLAGSSRGVQDYTVKTGWLFYNPLFTTVVEYPTYMQTAKWTRNMNEGDNPESPKGANEEISFNSAEGMQVTADISLSYQLMEQKIPQFYVTFRSDDVVHFTHGFLRNEARNAFNDVGSHYRIEDILGAKKEAFVDEATKLLQTRVTHLGVDIRQLGFIESPRPPQQVIDSINAKVQATQLALQKQNELIQSQAEAAKSVAFAEGQAKSAIAIANGEAEANRIRAASISPNILEWQKLMVTDRWISRWNGAVPQVNAGGSVPGLLLNIGH